jgi:hypothetical protein
MCQGTVGRMARGSSAASGFNVDPIAYLFNLCIGLCYINLLQPLIYVPSLKSPSQASLPTSHRLNRIVQNFQKDMKIELDYSIS